MDKQKYYLGLDCGTNSVGWAVTNEKYELLRRRGKTLWGFRLFDEAQTAAERRVNRLNRRRLARTRRRIKLLQMLFSEEMAKVDPDFYIRLKESFYLAEDKDFQNQNKVSKNTLFNDVDYKDKDFHKQYPTIWHLRNAILESADDDSRHFDIREYFLAIQHIMKNRGHFLIEGEMHGAGNFHEIWNSFCDQAQIVGFEVIKEYPVESALKANAGKLDKKRKLSRELFDAGADYVGDTKELAGLLVGSKVSLSKIFAISDKEDDLKISFAEGNFEEKCPEIETYLDTVEGALELVLAAKRIYDYIYLCDLLRGHESISAAMVENYSQHQKDLSNLKEALRSHKEDYDYFFKTREKLKDSDIFYAAYIGQAYSQDKNGRKKSYTIDQELINKKIEELLKKNGIEGDLLIRATERNLLPKQRGQAKGTIPQQLHHNELLVILKKLEKDFPSFAATNPNEDPSYNSRSKKIASLHDFRIPYYCGPIVSQQKSEFSWGNEEIDQIVYPWNFSKLVNLDQRAETFITRMTNECTYVLGADVLPKSSLLYQRYMVLNELNNLKINGKRIDNDIKQKIFEYGYMGGELKGNITLKQLARWLHSMGITSDSDDVGGVDEVKVLPKLSTHFDFKRILGDDYNKRYDSAKLEEVVKFITILGDERTMLRRKISQIISCDQTQAEARSKLGYRDWGRLSAEFLGGIRANLNGQDVSIIEALWLTNKNLMELLGGDFGFAKSLESHNSPKVSQLPSCIPYDAVAELYCSPAVKRTIWQAIKIIEEIKKVMGRAPQKLFLEVTRGADKGDKKRKLARRKDLIEKYKIIKSEDAKHLLDSLDKDCEDRDLQSKKLFLYYTQMGRCAYSGERIELDELMTRAYDIDHIYPRSKTKDDSVTRNLVLVKAELNREKTNVYPINDSVRAKMSKIWKFWYDSDLITKDKYDRLVRSEPLSTDELAGFIQRQIVETSQSIKAIRDLMEMYMPETKVIMVKASNVSELRHTYAQGIRSRAVESEWELEPRPEFIKIRELNDLHHAKDAYLNIVVGNVINSTFTDNPYEWVRRKKENGIDYSIRTALIFRPNKSYKLNARVETDMPEVKSWSFLDSIETISRTMRRNDVLWTRMSYEQKGALYDLQIVGKAQKTDGILPIKQDSRLSDTAKYGGYRSMSGAYFSLIELASGERKIVCVPIIYKNILNAYIAQVYGASTKIIIDKIKYKSLLNLNGFPVHLTGRTNDQLSLSSAKQIFFPCSCFQNIKKIISLNQKLTMDKDYKILNEVDSINDQSVNDIFSLIVDKLMVDFLAMPMLGNKIKEIKENQEKFEELELCDKVHIIAVILSIFSCRATVGDLSSIVPRASMLGKMFASNNISKMNHVELVIQSTTGLYEKRINLKTVQPGEL